MKTLYTSANTQTTDKGLVAIASTAVEDRQGEIVKVEGWDLKQFKKNPVLLWAHDHTQPPIGFAKRIWIEGTGKRAKLMFEPVFHEITELGRAIKRLYEEKVLRSFSVGFRPIDQDGDVFEKQELLEISSVSVPANQEAMMLAYKSLKGDFKDRTIEKVGVPVALVEQVGALDEKVKLLEGKVDTAVKGLQSLNPHPGRSQRLLEERLAVSKAIVRAADSYRAAPVHKRERLVKAIKLAGEKLIVSQKQELNYGKNKGT